MAREVSARESLEKPVMKEMKLEELTNDVFVENNSIALQMLGEGEESVSCGVV